MIESYTERIAEAATENDLNAIIEEAAFDDALSHAEYTRLYSLAMARVYRI